MALTREDMDRKVDEHSRRKGDAGLPTRQNRPTPSVESAREPAGQQLGPVALKTLTQALALVMGTEAMLAVKDVEPVEVHYYPHDGSVFLDTHYLIKGVAGAIFWKLAREHSHPGRQEFSTRELRLAGRELRLPEVQDNLSVRLLLLQRRLAERGAAMQIHKTGRGRFRVLLLRPMRLVQAPAQGTTHREPQVSQRVW